MHILNAHVLSRLLTHLAQSTSNRFSKEPFVEAVLISACTTAAAQEETSEATCCQLAERWGRVAARPSKRSISHRRPSEGAVASHAATGGLLCCTPKLVADQASDLGLQDKGLAATEAEEAYQRQLAKKLGIKGAARKTSARSATADAGNQIPTVDGRTSNIELKM